MSRKELFNKLYSNCTGHIELRAIKGDHVETKFISLSDKQALVGQVGEFCKDYKDFHIYFGIATRDGKGGAIENVINIPCVWAEMDYKDFPETPEVTVQGIIEAFPFKPTITTNSGGGMHLYFLLEVPVDLKRSVDVQKVNDWIRLELNKLAGCEFDRISDIPRILRLPGTVNHRYPHKPGCEIIDINDKTYKLDDFLVMIPASLETATVDTSKEPLNELYKGLIDGSRNTDLTRLVGSWVSDGLCFNECLENARIVNQRTSPPMDESEIVSIIKSIIKREESKAVTLVNSTHNTELGNSQRISHHYGDTLRHCGTWKKWLVWNDEHGAWQVDDSGKVIRSAKRTIQSMYSDASRLSDSQERKECVQWALSSESAKRIQAMIKLAESEEGIAVSPDGLDRDPWLLNGRNGTIDLGTGQLRVHNRDDLITMAMPVICDPNAECPKWLSFLDKVMDGNKKIISFLQRAVGYTLTGDTREQCFFILHGDGANGKSTFVKTIGTLLGDYAQAASFETFLSKRQGNVANNDIARMKGKRFISAVEADENRRLAENVIKQVTGGDVVAARFLYGEYFEFIPQFKIFLATNHKPKINCNDPAIWRRVKLIPFAVRIPEEEQILDLDDQLEAELSGILNWAIKGCLDWQVNGLQTPEEVESATKEYRKEMDTINEFLEECCTISSMLKVNPTDLYNAYKRHCELNGESFLTMRMFGTSLTSKGYDTSDSNGKRWRLGIGLKSKPEHA